MKKLKKTEIFSKRVSYESLYHPCNLEDIPFKSTKDIEPLEEFVGQERAVKGLEFGLKIDSDGFNIYAAGPPGTGKRTLILSILKELASRKESPSDWVYVYNFKDPFSPMALELPTGSANRFREDMESLVANTRKSLMQAFESDAYIKRKAERAKEFEQKKEKYISELNNFAASKGFSIQLTPTGYAIIPILSGKPVSPQEYEVLREDVKKEIQKKRTELEEKIQLTFRELRKIDKELSESLKKLDKEVAKYAISHLFEELMEKYRDLPQVIEYLKELEGDILENVAIFRLKEEELPKGPEDPFIKYKVNCLVQHSKEDGAPVVVEPIPSYTNLVGKVERELYSGILTTNFTLIRAGTLHRANGGYLVIEVDELFKHPFAYEALKNALKSGVIAIEELAERMGFTTARSLRPQPIPFKAKVILVGANIYYHLLYAYDSDFRELFKVKAHFDWEMSREKLGIMHYAGIVAKIIKRENLLPFERTAIAKVIEFGSRLVSDQKKLSTKFAEIADLVREGSFWANQEGAKIVRERHIKKALEEKKFRNNLIEEKIQEYFKRGIILLDTEGKKKGVVNGLAVSSIGIFSFGRPTRITVSLGVGRKGVVNIDREVGMSGKIHSKGVMILSGFLQERFAHTAPLTLSATLTFEQTYEEVEGDSASSTELYALLSELSGVPINQSFAVTGSINQKGEIQPIGGVNEKIEGFFKVCKLKGLTGRQGVLIPYQNIENLMLEEEVRDAIKKGKFHIFAIKTVEEGIEILTGVKAGELKDGHYEEGTIFGLVEKRLKEFSKKLKGRPRREEEDEVSPS